VGILPIHGFVLAGGKSSRMGQDKALLAVGGHPMVEIAVGKLRSFCAFVSIAGNRDDLAPFAEIVHETRTGTGPAAGIEAGLHAARQPWALFVPVDVPFVPPSLLRLWCDEALRVNMTVSFLGIPRKQPAFCLLRRERAAAFTRVLDDGQRRLENLLLRTAEADLVPARTYGAHDLYGSPFLQSPDDQTLERWFANLNTPGELTDAAQHLDPTRI
jgi:molybdopterin-guanine dinucleotide biosynthesis protein A